MLLKFKRLKGVVLPASIGVERTLYLVFKVDLDVTKEAVHSVSIDWHFKHTWAMGDPGEHQMNETSNRCEILLRDNK